MKFLLIVFFILVLLNVTTYLWPNKSNHAPHLQTQKTDLNANFIRLNKEIESDYYDRLNNRDHAFYGLDASKNRVSVEQSCYRLGPFVEDDNFEQAKVLLEEDEIEFTSERRQSKESNVFRVYLGPFNSQDEAVDARNELREKEVLDHFIRENSNGEPIVSLGIYTTQETLDDALALFEGSSIDVKYDEELVLLPESTWLFFALSDENINLENMLSRDWGEPAAKMGKFTCQP